MHSQIKPLIKRIIVTAIPSCIKELIFREVGKDHLNEFISMKWSIQNIKKLGFNPRCILDIGAHQGDWTNMVKDIYPEAKFYMVEPRVNKEIYLKQLSAQYPDSIFYSINLLGEDTGKKVQFFEMETGSSVYEEKSTYPRRPTTKQMIKLDDLMEQAKWDKAEFIKIDVQGYELNILKGGLKAVQSAECVLMEISLIQINRKAPLLDEVVSFMKNLGYLTYDICGLTRRPLDQALWQIDVIFLKKTSALLKNTSYDK